jgi:hypothetical protein
MDGDRIGLDVGMMYRVEPCDSWFGGGREDGEI